MKKRATLTRVTALASTLSLALIGMPGGTALAASLEAELYVTDNADPGPPDELREAGGFGYVVVSKVRGKNVWYVKAENLRKNGEQYYICNDSHYDPDIPCAFSLKPFTTDAEGDALVFLPEPDEPDGWVHVARQCPEVSGCFDELFDYGEFMKILTGKLQEGGGGRRGKP